MKDDKTESKARAFEDAAAAVPGASVDELRARLQVALEGTYVVGERLGEGGMGAVFLAKEVAVDRQVAIKVMRPVAGVRAEDWLRRFEQEASALAGLSHPGIVAVFGSGQTSDLAWIVMEAIEGTSLRELLRQDALTPAEALAIAPDMCRALQYAHENGVVHRDIKPENVLVDMEGRVKLVDFGLAMLRGEDGSRLTQREEVLGTLRYMAPEQLDTPLEVDHRADIFSMGVVLYEMLTGKVPHGIVRAPSTQVNVDVRLDEVVLRSLEREPERRYQLASDLVHRMEEIEAGPDEAPGPVAAAVAPRLDPEMDLKARRLQYRWGRKLDLAVVAASILVFAAFRLNVADAFALEDWSIQAGLLLTLALALPLVVAALVNIERTRISLPVVRVLSALLALGVFGITGALAGGFDGDMSRASELNLYFQAMLTLPMLPLLTAALSARYPISFVWNVQAARLIWALCLTIALMAAATSVLPWSYSTHWIQHAILAVHLGAAILLLFRSGSKRPYGSFQAHAVLAVASGIVATNLVLSAHRFIPAPYLAREPMYTTTLFLGALLSLVGGILGAGGGSQGIPDGSLSDGER